MAHSHSLRRSDPASFQAGHGARTAHRHNGYRSTTGSALENRDLLLRKARSTETVRVDDAGGRAHSDHDVMSS